MIMFKWQNEGGMLGDVRGNNTKISYDTQNVCAHKAQKYGCVLSFLPYLNSFLSLA